MLFYFKNERDSFFLHEALGQETFQKPSSIKWIEPTNLPSIFSNIVLWLKNFMIYGLLTTFYSWLVDILIFYLIFNII
jgi:hypothetical protein